MEKIVAYLDFHGCLLRGARPNRILNRYDRKRERDGGQRPFCVPANHFSPPLYPMSPIASCWIKPFPDPRFTPHHSLQRRVHEPSEGVSSEPVSEEFHQFGPRRRVNGG